MKNWIFFIASATIACFSSSACWAASLRPQQQLLHQHQKVDYAARSPIFQPRQRRDAHNIIEDCMMVTSKDGLFYYKSSPKEDFMPESTCGLYLITDPERQIEIEMLHMDISCEDGGLISVVDGWELNGEFFPSPEDHELPLEQRIVSDCGNAHTKSRYLSSQNVALIQYRVPTHGQGFSLRVRYVKNTKPCNILMEGTSSIFTMSNYGRKINCSITLLSPATISLISLNVGSTSGHGLLGHGSSHHGIFHKCEEQGSADYLEIGGSSGLDTSNLLVADSLCGMPGHDLKSMDEMIACGTTTVRLVSSGKHHNEAQVAIRPITDDDLALPKLVCPL